MYPLVVISYNNHFYVQNTLAQAAQYGLNAIVVDNASPYETTRRYLREIESSVEVIRMPENFAYHCWKRPEVYDRMPERFLLTDPDLQWNARLPMNFPSILDGLCTQYQTGKIGFALDISDGERMFADTDYFEWLSIPEWEARFWTKRVPHPTYELYEAPIDTMFQLFNKTNPCGTHIRIAGDFTAKHLPWYPETSIPVHDLIHMYVGCRDSTIAKLVLRDLARKKSRWPACEGCRHLAQF
jgi:hypothetical protein